MTIKAKIYFLTIGLLLGCFILANAQNKPNGEKMDYKQVIAKRSEKIVNGLGITDSAKYYRVCNIIIDQYYNLSNIHDTHDADVKKIKAANEDDKADVKSQVAEADSEMYKKLNQLHGMYLAKLATELSQEQIDEVKDAMTYKILPLTYAAYLDELPTLTDVQKRQIKAWLTEAREHAMDAGSSEKKHAWFGKYKGRINNYLSAQGYDMKKAGEEWQQRLKENKK